MSELLSETTTVIAPGGRREIAFVYGPTTNDYTRAVVPVDSIHMMFIRLVIANSLFAGPCRLSAAVAVGLIAKFVICAAALRSALW